ncbi:unnamed protein product, partial [Phaeothamnion confervicola]
RTQNPEPRTQNSRSSGSALRWGAACGVWRVASGEWRVAKWRFGPAVRNAWSHPLRQRQRAATGDAAVADAAGSDQVHGGRGSRTESVHSTGLGHLQPARWSADETIIGFIYDSAAFVLNMPADKMEKLRDSMLDAFPPAR